MSILLKMFKISFIILLTLNFASSSHFYKYKIQYYKQKVDHFSFGNRDSFNQRYLVNNEHWNKTGGPIFFYAGNEGDITLFAANTGFMWDIAPEFQAMIMFAEHRYYGKSLPYGKHAFSHLNYTGYLSSSQALADYADLLTFVRTSVDGAANSPIIVFGGSYGGMLAAWFRMKYPHVVQGAIAASAPILQFIGMTPCEKFGQVVTNDFAQESEMCVEVIRKSWAALDTIFKKKDGAKWITENWKLCDPIKSALDIKTLKEFLTNVWTNLAMADYPYPASFLAPLPAHPVKIVCDRMTKKDVSEEQILNQIFAGLSVYFNYTKTAKCLNYQQEQNSQLGDVGWDFQACTEMVMPFCYDGKKDFFEPSKWNLTDYATECYKKWRATPQPILVATEYGGEHIKASSNIVFSNGLLDPWSTGGVMKNLSSSLVAIIIPEGAHHLDLRQSDPNDPPSVIHAREVEKAMIRLWIKEYRELSHME